LPANSARLEEHDDVTTLVWSFDQNLTPTEASATLTLDQVVALSGGRVPVGLNPRLHPGPYDGIWLTHRFTKVWMTKGVLLDAAEQDSTIVTLSGGGLDTPRVISVTGDDPELSRGWRIAFSYREQVVARLNELAAAGAERLFWARQLPVLLIVVAFSIGVVTLRNVARMRRKPGAGPQYSAASVVDRAARPIRGATHAAD
jgi:high-affinity iron transporter